MLSKTDHTVPLSLIEEALENLPSVDGKFCINEPIGNFFYDPWRIKDEFVGTVWETIYNSLPYNKGEARIIKLEGGECYISHADIDDRWHLNLSGIKCYLTDLDRLKMHALEQDGIWYSMDAGNRHTASNFGNRIRYQLVVRQLLIRHNFKNTLTITVKAKPEVNSEDARFIFDDVISPWLNAANKLATITNFSFNNGTVSFETIPLVAEKFKELLPSEFEINETLHS